MTTIYQLRTFSDIISATMDAMKLQSTDTTSKNRIKRDINTIYQNEVAPYAQWKWLRNSFQSIHEAYVSTGTAALTENSVTITLTDAPTTSKAGFYFKADGHNEIYKIFAHTASSTTVTLEVPYTGDTSSAATYKIWTDRIVLPTECRDTLEVYTNWDNTPLEGVGLQELRRRFASNPFIESRPTQYSTSDYVDPAPYQAVGSLPAVSTRASAGLVKTIVFASTVASLLQEGDIIKVSGSGHYSYDGEFVISSISTTTMTYTGKVPYVESATSASSTSVTKLSTEKDTERYKELIVYPSLFNERTTLSVDYIKEPQPLIEDSDEPLMPLSDRIVLLYGALMLAWARERNETQSDKQGQMYLRKLEQMAGKVDDSTDLPKLTVGKNYLAAKRRKYKTKYKNYNNF